MRKPTKTEMILLLCFIYCSFAAIITIPLIEYTYHFRGYFALGGEILPILSIPFVLFITAIAVLTEGGK